MQKDILLVDKEAACIGMAEMSLKTHGVMHVTSYGEALKSLKKPGGFKLVITELGLNGDDGFKFLNMVRRDNPEIIRIILTAKTDPETFCTAINDVGVFQYICKPCEPKKIRKHLVKSLAYYDMRTSQRNAARQTLIGSVKALVDILDMVNPEAMGFSKRIRDRVVAAGKALGFRPLWHLELAVMLSHIGCVALPTEILAKMDACQPLTPEEGQIFAMHPRIASDLLANIEQMAPIAAIVGRQHDPYSENQPMGARIIKVALDLDQWERKGKDLPQVLKRMQERDKLYDPSVVKAMLELLKKTNGGPVRRLKVDELREGMVMAEDLINNAGVKLLLRGQTISKASLLRLRNFHAALGITGTVNVVEGT